MPMPVLGPANPWTASNLLEPSVLADQVKSGTEKWVIFNIGAVEDIQGATHIGLVSNPENLSKLKMAIVGLPRTTAIVIYCGCCPFAKCPNIRPAFSLLQKEGFVNIKLLNLTKNLQTDWIAKGTLEVKHLKRYWHKCILKRQGALEQDAFADEWRVDTTLLTVMGLGLEQSIQYVYGSAPSFQEFENWIVEVSGKPATDRITLFNKIFEDNYSIVNDGKSSGQSLTAADFGFWLENGYLIIKDAGIMIQLFQHPLLDQNRTAPKIRRAFEDLWARSDIWVDTDRVGFNPPETQNYQFQGPRLHWDCSIQQPIPFGTQGILYLADTAENQGAFTLIPGKENLYAMGPIPIAANAGDFIIWHQALPHGSSPNTASLPRFVQYINYEPANEKDNRAWL
eukprot:gene814-818_t